jgi:hypothetical protein
MFFTAEQVVRLTESQLVAFLDRAVSEATGVVDYKSDVTTEKPERAHAELLKDVSSFANANGGHVFIGVQEPDREGAGATLVRGVADGPKLATAIEQRCGAGIDPRVPGLRVVPVSLANGKFVIVIHVPPSANRPHMVIHAPTATRSFFVRHSETTFPMSTAEIRHAVLTSAAGVGEARDYAASHSRRLSGSLGNECVMVVDATPLVPVEVPWDVTGGEWEPVMFGEKRPARRLRIRSLHRRVPTVDGIAAIDDRRVSRLAFEVHRMGYIGAAMRIDVREELDRQRVVMLEAHLDFLRSFGDLCDEALSVAKSDRPYLLRLRVDRARDTVFGYGQLGTTYSQPFTRDEIIGPELRRDSGQSFGDVVDAWMPIIWNAYGLEYDEERR